MQQHSRLIVEDGSSLFFYTNWTGQGILVDFFTEPLGELQHAAIRDLYQDGAWCTDQFAMGFPDAVMECILTFSFTFTTQPDYLVWEPTSSGVFKLSSAYDLLRDRQPEHLVLKWVWCRSIPLRISVFMWRLLNSLLPFPDILSGFGFCLPSRCPFCAQHSDTLAHCFAGCTLTQRVWQYFLDLFGIVVPSQHSVTAFFLACWTDSTVSPLTALLHLLPSFICWGLWRLRNLIVYEGVLPSDSYVRTLVSTMYGDATSLRPFKVSPQFVSLLSPLPFISFVLRRCKVSILHWDLPGYPFVKLNVDGSSLGNPGHAGGGFVIRNWSGVLLAAHCFYLGVTTSLGAEIQALLRGLTECHRLGLQFVEVETDSDILVQMVQRRIDWPWRSLHELRDIIHILSLHPTYQLRHIFREVNSVADYLARLASADRTTQDFTTTPSPPFMQGILQLDCLAYPYIRRRLAIE